MAISQATNQLTKNGRCRSLGSLGPEPANGRQRSCPTASSICTGSFFIGAEATRTSIIGERSADDVSPFALLDARSAASPRRKTARRRVDHLGGAVGDLHHRQPPLVGSIGAETEHAVGAVEARYAGQRRLVERVRHAVAGERGGQRHRVIGERRQTRRVAVEFGPVALGEGVEAGIVGRGEPGALHLRQFEHARVVPHAGSQELGLDVG